MRTFFENFSIIQYQSGTQCPSFSQCAREYGGPFQPRVIGVFLFSFRSNFFHVARRATKAIGHSYLNSGALGTILHDLCYFNHEIPIPAFDADSIGDRKHGNYLKYQQRQHSILLLYHFRENYLDSGPRVSGLSIQIAGKISPNLESSY